MNSREKRLALILIISVAVGILFTGTNSYFQYKQGLTENLEKAIDDFEKYELTIGENENDLLTIAELQRRSLNPDRKQAVADYKNWLIHLLEKELEIEEVRITNEPSRQVDNQYWRHTFRINCASNLETLTDLLYRFETKPLLHRIKDLAVTPNGYDQLQLSLSIEAISLTTVDEENVLQDVVNLEHDESLVEGTREEFWTRISNRNFFGRENKEPTFTAPPITATVGEKETRTLTASAGVNEQNIQEISFEIDQDTLPTNFVASLVGNRLTVSSDEVGTYQFNVKVTDTGLPAKTIVKPLSVSVREKPAPRPVQPRPEPPKPPEFNVAQLAYFTSTIEINNRVQVWIHRRDLGQILKLPLGAEIAIGTIKGKIHAVNQRYLTILTADNELLEIKAGKALSTAQNITAQAEGLLTP
ncbi:MAG: hypothetical protein CMJ79_06915 [Planctomycetaceae bacterium]|nr:hypothetical protein [Planctomycetaceae bacterium]|tara:strand:- start:432 stop:1679 length:1248 start_codon:yes stop_codon:yes gene_type:complete